MTAKEVIEEIYYNGTYNTGIKKRHFEILEQYANQKTRHIAEQAVSDERNTYRGEHYPGMEGNNLMNRILTRINELTQGE